jgi:hypothetical protein
VNFRAGARQFGRVRRLITLARFVQPRRRGLRGKRHLAPAMQGHDAYAECARNLALQLSLRRQVTCLRELGGDLRLRVSVGGGLQTCLALARATSDPYTRLSLLTMA